MRLILSTFLILFFTVQTVTAQTFHPKIIYGRVVPERSSAAVLVVYRNGSNGFSCTGSLLTSKIVLTAWHCIGSRHSKMEVVVRGRVVKVSKVKLSSRTRRDRSTGAIYEDLALLTLKTPVGGPYLPLLTSRSVTAGDTIAIYGYGLDENRQSGRLKGGTMLVDDVSKDFIGAPFDSSENDTCFGDSGGPAVLSYVDSRGNTRTGIVGVTSTGTSDTCSSGDYSIFINLQGTALSFISQNAKGARYK